MLGLIKVGGGKDVKCSQLLERLRHRRRIMLPCIRLRRQPRAIIGACASKPSKMGYKIQRTKDDSRVKLSAMSLTPILEDFPWAQSGKVGRGE